MSSLMHSVPCESEPRVAAAGDNMCTSAMTNALSLHFVPLFLGSHQNLVSVFNRDTVWSNFSLSQDYGNRDRSTDVTMHQAPCKR